MLAAMGEPCAAPGGAARRERGALAALRHRPFALVWSAALVSSIGTWMQALAAPYQLFELTHSNTWLGIASGASMLPALALMPLAGVLADRLSRRRIILATQLVQVAVALALFALARAAWLSPGLLVGLLAVAGAASGLQLASWQSFVPLLLPPQLLADGVRLNTLQFTASRALGPALAGGVLAAFGVATAFLLNAVSFVLVFLAVAASRPREAQVRVWSGVARDVAEGFRYTRGNPTLWIAVLTAFAVAFFGHSVGQVAAGLAKQVFAVGPSGLGAMTASIGAGAMSGSVLIALFPDRHRRSSLAQTGLFSYALGIAGVALAPVLFAALPAFFLMGLSHVAVMMSVNTALQTRVPEPLRGRVISIHLAALFAGLPAGALSLGRLGDAFGLRAALGVSAALLFGYACVAWWRFRRLSVLDR